MAVADVLQLDPGGAAFARYGRPMPSPSRVADPSTPPSSLRQMVTEQGGTILGLMLQSRLIHPDAPPLPALQVEPDVPTDGGSVSADQAERCSIHLAYRAKMAAARICLPKRELAAALRAIHLERRACLRALGDKIVARRAGQAHERLARRFRRAAALTACGVPPRPVFESPEDTQARVRAAILSKLGD